MRIPATCDAMPRGGAACCTVSPVLAGALRVLTGGTRRALRVLAGVLWVLPRLARRGFPDAIPAAHGAPRGAPGSPYQARHQAAAAPTAGPRPAGAAPAGCDGPACDRRRRRGRFCEAKLSVGRPMEFIMMPAASAANVSSRVLSSSSSPRKRTVHSGRRLVCSVKAGQGSSKLPCRLPGSSAWWGGRSPC